MAPGSTTMPPPPPRSRSPVNRPDSHSISLDSPSLEPLHLEADTASSSTSGYGRHRSYSFGTDGGLDASSVSPTSISLDSRPSSRDGRFNGGGGGSAGGKGDVSPAHSRASSAWGLESPRIMPDTEAGMAGGSIHPRSHSHSHGHPHSQPYGSGTHSPRYLSSSSRRSSELSVLDNPYGHSNPAEKGSPGPLAGVLPSTMSVKTAREKLAAEAAAYGSTSEVLLDDDVSPGMSPLSPNPVYPEGYKGSIKHSSASGVNIALEPPTPVNVNGLGIVLPQAKRTSDDDSKHPSLHQPLGRATSPAHFDEPLLDAGSNSLSQRSSPVPLYRSAISHSPIPNPSSDNKNMGMLVGTPVMPQGHGYGNGSDDEGSPAADGKKEPSIKPSPLYPGLHGAGGGSDRGGGGAASRTASGGSDHSHANGSGYLATQAEQTAVDPSRTHAQHRGARPYTPVGGNYSPNGGFIQPLPSLGAATGGGGNGVGGRAGLGLGVGAGGYAYAPNGFPLSSPAMTPTSEKTMLGLGVGGPYGMEGRAGSPVGARTPGGTALAGAAQTGGSGSFWDSSAWWLIMYFCFNLGLTLFNKVVLKSFPFPYTLTGLHALSGCAGCYMALEQGAFVPARLTQKENLILAAFSVLYTINIAVSNISLQLVTVPFHQVVRASTPLFTILIATVILRQKFSIMKLVSLLPVVAGVGFATYGDYYFTQWGLFLTLLGTFLAALKTVVTNLIQTGGGARLKLHPLDLLMRMSPLAFIQCVLYGLYTGELERVRRYGATQMTQGKAFALLINGVIACGLNIVSFTANKKAGALTMTVSANCKQVLTIALAVVLFDLHINFLNGIGILLTLVGGGWYGYVEFREKSKKQVPARKPST